MEECNCENPKHEIFANVIAKKSSLISSVTVDSIVCANCEGFLQSAPAGTVVKIKSAVPFTLNAEPERYSGFEDENGEPITKEFVNGD